MSEVSIIYGEESTENYKLSVYDYYVKSPNCPISYNHPFGNPMRILGLEKTNVSGKDSARIVKTSFRKLPYLNPSNQFSETSAYVSGWSRVDYVIPDNVIIKMHFEEGRKTTKKIASKRAVVFFRVRSTGPLLSVNYKNDHGFEYLIRGRMDKLSVEYVTQNGLLSDMRMMSTISDSVVESIVDIVTVEKATLDLEATNFAKVNIGGSDILIPEIKAKRRIRR